MSSDAIFLQVDGGNMMRAPLGEYVTEDVLQTLVAQYPELLAGEQINEEDPPRWLLVSREAGVPDAADASSRWSVDHLLVDHRSVPTFVEVKRSSDTRIRREIVGQMLDYAANATTYWPVDRIRSLAAEQSGGNLGLDRRVCDLLGIVADDATAAVETFWRTVEENLRSGRLRLLFVADELPRELRRIIEFLNEHMSSIEVLGVELRRYQGAGVQALVPRVVGQTERARASRVGQAKRQTSVEEFLAGLSQPIQAFFQSLFAQAQRQDLTISWGTKGFSLRAMKPSGELVSLLYGYPPGAVGRDMPILEVYLKSLGDGDMAQSLRSELLAFPGFRERGQFTIGFDLTPESVAAAELGLPSIWRAYGRIREGAA